MAALPDVEPLDSSERLMFRWMNDRVREVQKDWPVTVYDLFCECSDAGCLRVLTLERAIYEPVLGDVSHFVVLPGHQRTAYERIVEVRATHVVVKPYQPTSDSHLKQVEEGGSVAA